MSTMTYWLYFIFHPVRRSCRMQSFNKKTMSDQLVIVPFNYLLRGQWRLIRLRRSPGWSESLLGAHVILLARLNEVHRELLYYPRRWHWRQRPQMLKFYVKVFRTSFSNPLMELVYIWYDDRYWSKILFCTIVIPMHDLKVKVTDLELLC